jgi:hypothetical protein
MSHSPEDRARLDERFPGGIEWDGRGRYGKAGSFNPIPWFAYIGGRNPGFPDQVLDDTYAGICQRLERIEQDDQDVDSWDVHHWQDLNPVIPEGLVQMAMGTPAAVYHGGLLHASVRYYDPRRRRPGLPEHVAALVERIDDQGIGLTLVNTDLLEGREVIVQAGAFGEHAFTEAVLEDATGEPRTVAVNGRHLLVCLGPSAQARLALGMSRFANQPTFAFPSFE